MRNPKNSWALKAGESSFARRTAEAAVPTWISVQRADYCGVEIFIVDRGRPGWLWAGAPYDDHDVLCRIDVDRLPEDADRQECALMNRIWRIWNPPHVSVVDLLASDDLAGSGFVEPPFGKNLFLFHPAVIHSEQPKATIVAQGGA